MVTTQQALPENAPPGYSEKHDDALCHGEGESLILT
jgi:hypothetical protein